MKINNQSFKVSIMSTLAIFALIFGIMIAVTPMVPRNLIIFGNNMKVAHRLFKIEQPESSQYTLISNKQWIVYNTLKDMRGWIRSNVELERISDLTIKDTEKTLNDGVGDRNDMALLLINMIYVISGEKVDLVQIKEKKEKSEYPMYYLYYENVVYEVFNSTSYRGREILKRLTFDELFGL